MHIAIALALLAIGFGIGRIGHNTAAKELAAIRRGLDAVEHLLPSAEAKSLIALLRQHL